MSAYSVVRSAGQTCFEANGGDPKPIADTYREHLVWYMRGLGMKGDGMGDGTVGYVLANRPIATSYTRPADGRRSFSGLGHPVHVERLGLGEYF